MVREEEEMQESRAVSEDWPVWLQCQCAEMRFVQTEEESERERFM